MTKNRSNPYRAAGTFAGPSYTERKADRDLLRAIKQNQRYPYVLAPRQSGKSSLITHVRAKLPLPEFRTAFIDFSIFEPTELSNIDKFQDRFFLEWYHSLGLNEPLVVSDRFLDRVEQLLYLCTENRVVTFLDEIDALSNAKFKDTFFSVLRNIFNERASTPVLARIQFVLSGAARSDQLIADPLRSPFNVGENILLNDLSLQQTAETCTHVADLCGTAKEEVAQRVYEYANGSVYLTQLILEKLWNRIADREEADCRFTADLVQDIEKVVVDIVAEAGQDIHFKNIKASLEKSAEVAVILRKLVENRTDTLPADRELLWFTGLSPRQGDRLYRNKIYELVFQSGGPLDLGVERTPIPHNLPSLQPFYGREDYLGRIAEALDPESRTWGALIDGPGGIGKTSLAIRAAYDAPTEAFDKIVFVSLKSRELDDDGVRDLSGFLISGLAELLNELARELGRTDIVKAPEYERPRMLLHALRGTRTLLVLDNLESLLKRERDTIFTFVKRLPSGCKAILTSRVRIGSAAEELILEKLSETAALATLAKLAENNTSLAKSSQVERLELYRQTGGNPLLLRWAAGQIGRGSCQTLNDAIIYLRSCPSTNDPLEFIFGDLMEDLNEAEMLVLSALTYFSLPAKLEHITEVAGRSESDTGHALRSLINRSVVVPSDELRSFVLVQQVADFLRKRKPEIVAATGSRLEQCVYELVVENGYEQHDRFHILNASWPIIAAALPRFLSGPNDRLQTVCRALDVFLNFSGRWDEQLALSRDAESRAAAVQDFSMAGWRAYDAGGIYYLRGQSSEMLACADRSESHWWKAQVGTRERAFAILLRGGAHSLVKDYVAAITAYREAVELLQTLSHDNEDLAIGLNALAGAESACGDFDAAERDYEEALQIARAMKYSEGIASYTGNLAGLALDRQDWSRAESLAREALTLSEKVGRLELIALNCHRVASTLARQRRKAEALSYARRAVEIFNQLGSHNLEAARAILAECETS